MDQLTAQLARWDVARPETYAEVLASPAFPAAARALAANMLTLVAEDEALDATFRDAGRYIAAMGTVYLHGLGELTLPRLKELCAASGFLSAGRVRDLLNVMQHQKCIEQVSLAAGAVPARYAPSLNFMVGWRRHHRAALEAASRVEPAVEPLLARFEDDAFADLYSRMHVSSLFATARGWGDAQPFTRIFLHRLAGNQIAWTLFSSGDGTRFPPQGRTPFPTTDFARRFGVSRIHAKRMLDDAVSEGLLRRGDGETVEFLEAAQPEIQQLYAGQLIFLLSAARETLAELGKRRAAGSL